MNIDFLEYIDIKTLTGGIFGAGLVWFGEWIKSKFINSKKSHYLAVRLIPILEQLLDGCYAVAFDSGEEDSEGCYHTTEKHPVWTLPDDVEWMSIDRKLLERIMNLSKEYYSLQKRIDAEEEHNAFPPYDEIIYFTQVEFSKFALELDNVLSDVRAILKLDPLEYDDEWYNPRKRCSKFVEQAKENAKKAEEAREKQFLEMREVISPVDKETK